jgi:hypothetical protein
MAAKTPTIIDLGPAGNARHLICQFADIDDGDTWASSLTGILSKVIDNKTDGVVVSATLSSTTFTFTVAGSGSNKVVDMHVYVRS